MDSLSGHDANARRWSMTVESYSLFALVTLASVTLVALGAMSLSRRSLKIQVAVAIGWLTVHASAFAVGLDSVRVTNPVVVGSAAGIAVLLARTVRTPGSLIALAITASVVDVVSFSAGPTRALLDSDSLSDALRYLAVSARYDGDLVAVVGIGDLVVFGALYLGLTGQGHRRSSVWTALSAGLLAALAIGLAWGGAFGIPFMAVGAIALAIRGRPNSVTAPSAQGGSSDGRPANRS